MIVTVPWSWQVAPTLMRKWPASVPEPAPAPPVMVHVPSSAFAPPDAAASQSLGSVPVASSVPLSAVAGFAGGEPLRSSRVGAVPMVVS